MEEGALEGAVTCASHAAESRASRPWTGWRARALVRARRPSALVAAAALAAAAEPSSRASATAAAATRWMAAAAPEEAALVESTAPTS